MAPSVHSSNNFVIMVLVRCLASFRASSRCDKALNKLIYNLSEENVSNAPILLIIETERDRSGYSLVVKTASQESHWRLLHMHEFFLEDLEFTTFVFPLQYIHTMSIYCHNAWKNGSGKEII